MRALISLAGAARLYEEAEWYPEAINMYIRAEDYVSEKGGRHAPRAARAVGARGRQYFRSPKIGSAPP